MNHYYQPDSMFQPLRPPLSHGRLVLIIGDLIDFMQRSKLDPGWKYPCVAYFNVFVKGYENH